MIKLLHIEKNIPQSVLSEVLNTQSKLHVDGMFVSRHIQEHFDWGDHKHGYTKEGLFACLKEMKKNPVTPFEVEVSVSPDKHFVVTKYVVRLPYDSSRDISIAIRGKKVITAWLNHVTDTHKTLDLSKYEESL